MLSLVDQTNVAMICEVQIRVTGAPDDHIMYEIRRNLKPQARFLFVFTLSLFVLFFCND